MKILQLMLISVVLVACSGPARIPDDRYYRLLAVDKSIPSANDSGINIVVLRPHADSLYLQRSLVYSNVGSPRELLQYHYHFWVETPSEMLQHQLIRTLRVHFGNSNVSENAYNGSQSWYLRTTLKKLDRVETSKGWRAEVGLSVELANGRHAKPVWVADYEVSKMAGDDSMTASVAAFDNALLQVLEQLIADISSHASPG